MTALPSHPDMNDPRMSDAAQPLYEKVLAFLRDEVEPVSVRFEQLHENRPSTWEWHPEQLQILEALKGKAGAGDPRCKIMIVMVRSNDDGPPHQQQSQILVPTDTPGFEIAGAMHVFGDDDAPHGHMHLRFNNCRVPKDNILLGEGRGFEISQMRLGPGRIHHCMRSIGAAEKAIELMVKRGITRDAFGKKLANLGKNTEMIAKARIEIESMRMMVLKAAKAMDVLGNAQARVWVSAIKAMVPVRVCAIIDDAMQIHGGTGVSQWTPLAGMYARQRTLRLADGPDEVHWHVVGRAEIAHWVEQGGADYDPKADYYAGLNESAGGVLSGP